MKKLSLFLILLTFTVPTAFADVYIENDHKYFKGIDEKMSIDNNVHSFFGVSKSYADLLVQEYGSYFNLRTACFRGGCLTGENHSGTQLHGFLSFLVICPRYWWKTDKQNFIF